MDISDALLDLIYDTATEPQLWPALLTAIADITSSQGGIIFGQSLGAETVYFDYNGRLCEDCNRAYKERHVRNPWNEAMVSQPVGRIVFSDEVLPLADLQATLFFDDVLRPQNVAHNAMIALMAENDFHAAFNICRSQKQGAFTERERFLLGTLVPHLRRALKIGFRLEAYKIIQRAGFEALDRFSAGVILLDQRAQILYRNKAAQSLELAGVFSVRNSMLSSASREHSGRLNDLITKAIRGTPACSMSLPRPDGQPVTVLISQVRGNDLQRFHSSGFPNAAALMFLIDPMSEHKAPIDRIVDAYGLTDAEARVALVTSSGITVNEAAKQLGLSTNTVKTHLRKIFAKMGIDGQAQMARRLAALHLLEPKE